jgi:hypothetical protein
MGIRRWAGFLLSAGLGALPSMLPGQDVQLGSRIRVTAPTLGLNKTVGTFQGMLADSLRLDSVVVPLRSVSRLEVSRGTSRAWGQGLVMGLAAGALAGVAVGASACEEGFVFSASSCVAAAGLGGGLAGMLVGTVVGTFIKHEKWTRLHLEPLVAERGGGAGLRLGLALTF